MYLHLQVEKDHHAWVSAASGANELCQRNSVHIPSDTDVSPDQRHLAGAAAVQIENWLTKREFSTR